MSESTSSSRSRSRRSRQAREADAQAYVDELLTLHTQAWNDTLEGTVDNDNPAVRALRGEVRAFVTELDGACDPQRFDGATPEHLMNLVSDRVRTAIDVGDEDAISWMWSRYLVLAQGRRLKEDAVRTMVRKLVELDTPEAFHALEGILHDMGWWNNFSEATSERLGAAIVALLPVVANEEIWDVHAAALFYAGRALDAVDASWSGCIPGGAEDRA